MERFTQDGKLLNERDSGMAYVRLVDSHVLIEGVPPESDTKNPEINLAQAEIRARQYNVDAEGLGVTARAEVVE